MTAQIVQTNQPEIVTLEDGRTLDERQSAAVLAHVRDGLSGEELAKAAGYSGHRTANAFIRSELGKMGVQAAIRIVLAEAGAIGLSTAIRLATKAKSEKVQLDAALSLMDRAGITVVDPRAPRAPADGKGISISISLNGSRQDGSALVDVTPDEQS